MVGLHDRLFMGCKPLVFNGELMKKILLLSILFLLFIRIAVSEVIPLPDLIHPDSLVVDSKQFYIMERESISIYSLKDFKLKKKFGKTGEGPQEFLQRIMGLSIQSDFLVITSMGKVSFFKKDGTFIREKKLTSPLITNLNPVGDRYVGIEFTSGALAIHIFNSKFEKIKKLSSFSIKYSSTKYLKMYPSAFQFRVHGNKIFLAADKEFVIDVFNTAGNQIKTIKHKYQRLRCTSKHQEQYFEELKNNRKASVFYEYIKKKAKFPDYFPAVKNFFVTGDKIYVQTYKVKDNHSEFFILDIDGRLLKKMFLPLPDESLYEGAKFTIFNGKLYHLYEDEKEEQWKIRVIEIN
jgi:hypothetical protein